MLCKESKTKYYDVELFGLTAGMGIIVPRMLFSCLRSLQLHTALNNERPQKTERGQYLSSILLEIRRGENPRSQNRPSKTRRGAAVSGFAGLVLGPWIEPSLISY